MSDKIKVGVLGASGYTGADLVRLALCHPHIELVALSANAQAGKEMGDVYPHFAFSGLPRLEKWETVDWSAIDAVFCGLPHGTTQEITKTLFQTHPKVKIIDLSADFRLRDPEIYAATYGKAHKATDIQPEAVYGLPEHHREPIASSRLVACPGCYPTAVLLSLLPLASTGLIEVQDIIIDAKSGVSGAGRGLKENTLFCEAGEGLSPYAVGKHRHAPEIEQELSAAAGVDMKVNFTPHLVPMSRGELVTCHLRLANGATVPEVRECLASRYADEPFVDVLPEGQYPATQHVRGSNFVRIGVVEDRIPGRVIVIGTLDNLVKGSSGQALQNFNLMFGLPETTGLKQLALFP